MGADVEWAGTDRRRPGLADPARLTLRPLAAALREAVETEVVPRGGGQVILDLGCGDKPYLPFFSAVAGEYVGLDLAPGPRVDVVGPADELPFEDGRFDVVLATQMLEHVLDPPRVIREVHRVLRPGGVALLTTHGTAAYHPSPTDLWRWTQEGLEKVIADNGAWSTIRLAAAGGTAACFGYLLNFYVGTGLRAPALTPLRVPAVALVNGVFGALDRVVPLHYPRKFTLISNFLAVARKA